MTSAPITAAATSAGFVSIAILDPAEVGPPAVRGLLGRPNQCHCRLLFDSPTAQADWGEFGVLIVVEPESDGAPPLGVRKATDQGRATPSQEAAQNLECVVVATRRAEEAGVPIIVLSSFPREAADGRTAILQLPLDSATDTVLGAARGLAAARRVLRGSNDERARLGQVSKSINRHFDLLNSELRLASRLQRDFLPAERIDINGVRFSSFYRPCAWVGGDIFDIMRIDQDHVAFYLADVAGHGMAAGLMTMYVKHAIEPIMRTGHGDAPASPAHVLSRLNNRIVGEGLRDSLFITCWYGLLNTRTRTLDYCTAGHPPPIFVHDETISELWADGGLLGLVENQEYVGGSIQLAPGDRVLLYSDGLEGVLIDHRPPRPQAPTWKDGITHMLNQTTETVLSGLLSRLDLAPGSLNKADDASVVMLDLAVAVPAR